MPSVIGRLETLRTREIWIPLIRTFAIPELFRFFLLKFELKVLNSEVVKPNALIWTNMCLCSKEKKGNKYPCACRDNTGV